MAEQRPNIVLIMTDQQRGDCLGVAGHPDVMTPNLDELACSGSYFPNAYTQAPVCCPARHSLMTGCEPATNGVLNNQPARIRDPETTLPNLLRKSGYQTAHVGRSQHQHPSSARYGFEVREFSPFQSHDSHAHWTVRRTSDSGEFGNWPHLLNHGMSLCGFRARPWPYDEMFHETTWSINKAIEYLDRRDPEAPYFLSVGVVAPHPPLVPPAPYYDRYDRMELTPPAIGTWAQRPDNDGIGSGIHSGHVPLRGKQLHTTMAGYYGLINHFDDMLYNLIYRINVDGQPTTIIFTSDHGEQLGDHYLFRKEKPYQGSVHVPFMMRGYGVPSGHVTDAPVSHIDVLPTCCELAGIDTPSHVEGRSLLSRFRDDESEWREFLHGEIPHSQWCKTQPGCHYLVDGTWKYIWFSGDGREQLFHLAEDPRELQDLAADTAHADTLVAWRKRLVEKLADRPEGFVEDGALVPGREHKGLLPHAVPV